MSTPLNPHITEIVDYNQMLDLTGRLGNCLLASLSLRLLQCIGQTDWPLAEKGRDILVYVRA